MKWDVHLIVDRDDDTGEKKIKKLLYIKLFRNTFHAIKCNVHLILYRDDDTERKDNKEIAVHRIIRNWSSHSQIQGGPINNC